MRRLAPLSGCTLLLRWLAGGVCRALLALGARCGESASSRGGASSRETSGAAAFSPAAFSRLPNLASAAFRHA